MAHAFLKARKGVQVIQRCTKVQYATLKEARKAMGQQRKRNTGLVASGVGRLMAYRCKICGGFYHIGHS